MSLNSLVLVCSMVNLHRCGQGAGVQGWWVDILGEGLESSCRAHRVLGRLPHTSECRKRLLCGPWGVGTEVFWSETVHVFCKHIGLLPFGCALLGES